MQIVPNGMPNPVFWEKKKKINKNLLSAKLAKRVVKINKHYNIP